MIYCSYCPIKYFQKCFQNPKIVSCQIIISQKHAERIPIQHSLSYHIKHLRLSTLSFYLSVYVCSAKQTTANLIFVIIKREWVRLTRSYYQPPECIKIIAARIPQCALCRCPTCALCTLGLRFFISARKPYGADGWTRVLSDTLWLQLYCVWTCRRSWTRGGHFCDRCVSNKRHLCATRSLLAFIYNIMRSTRFDHTQTFYSWRWTSGTVGFLSLYF